MDFFNNSKGRDIGILYNPFTGNLIIANAVLQALYDAHLVYLSPLGPNGEILTNTQIIPTN